MYVINNICTHFFAGHSAVFSSLTNAMIVFGGSSSEYLNDMCILMLDTRTWEPCYNWSASSIHPSPRVYHTSFLNDRGEMFVMFGYNGSFLDDTYKYTISQTNCQAESNCSATITQTAATSLATSVPSSSPESTVTPSSSSSLDESSSDSMETQTATAVTTSESSHTSEATSSEETASLSSSSSSSSGCSCTPLLHPHQILLH